jgi:hypothetical protein
MKKSWLFRGLGVIGLIAMAVLLMISPVLANTTTTTTAPPTPPTVTTNDATYSYMSSTGQAEITFNGTLTIGSYKSVFVYFEYGLTDIYGYSTAKVAQKSSGTFEATAITNPTIGQIYNYRADVKYGSTVIHGNNETAVINSSGPSGSSIGASDSFIYFDQLHGGTIFSGADGTAVHPVNNVDDVLTLLDQTDLSCVFICNGSTFTMAQDMSAVSFWGDDKNSCTLDFNSFGGQNLAVHNCLVQSEVDATGTVNFYNCSIENLKDDMGQNFYDCDVYSYTHSPYVQFPVFMNCTFYEAGVNCDFFDILNAHGSINVFNMTGGVSFISGSALSVLFTASCTGSVTIQGSGIDVNNHNSPVVITDLTDGNQLQYFNVTLNTTDKTNLFNLGNIGGVGAPVYDIDNLVVSVTLAEGDSITFNLYEDIDDDSILAKSNIISTAGVYTMFDLFGLTGVAGDSLALTATSVTGTTSTVAGTIVFRCN